MQPLTVTSPYEKCRVWGVNTPRINATNIYKIYMTVTSPYKCRVVHNNLIKGVRMGIHKTTLEERCPECGEPLVEVHIKNPFIDDFIEGCDNPYCKAYKDMRKILNNRGRSIAKWENS